MKPSANPANTASPSPEDGGPLPRDSYPLAVGPNVDHLEQQAIAAHRRPEDEQSGGGVIATPGPVDLPAQEG